MDTRLPKTLCKAVRIGPIPVRSEPKSIKNLTRPMPTPLTATVKELGRPSFRFENLAVNLWLITIEILGAMLEESCLKKGRLF
jgi:hypothetical protein